MRIARRGNCRNRRGAGVSRRRRRAGRRGRGRAACRAARRTGRRGRRGEGRRERRHASLAAVRIPRSARKVVPGVTHVNGIYYHAVFVAGLIRLARVPVRVTE
eukprot:1438497-Pyramimonas_sp.AAC.1